MSTLNNRFHVIKVYHDDEADFHGANGTKAAAFCTARNLIKNDTGDLKEVRVFDTMAKCGQTEMWGFYEFNESVLQEELSKKFLN